MLIPIRLPRTGSDSVDGVDSADEALSARASKRTRSSVPEDLLLVELQGDVEPRTAKALDGLPLGNLTVQQNDKASLVIGNHLLMGKMVKMSKPLLAIRKVGGAKAAQGAKDAADLSDGGGSGSGTGDLSYEIVSLVRHKFIFTANPTPLNRMDPRVKCPLGVTPVAAAEAAAAAAAIPP